MGCLKGQRKVAEVRRLENGYFFYLSNAVMINAGVHKTVPDKNTLVTMVSNIA